MSDQYISVHFRLSACWSTAKVCTSWWLSVHCTRKAWTERLNGDMVWTCVSEWKTQQNHWQREKTPSVLHSLNASTTSSHIGLSWRRQSFDRSFDEWRRKKKNTKTEHILTGTHKVLAFFSLNSTSTESTKWTQTTCYHLRSIPRYMSHIHKAEVPK